MLIFLHIPKTAGFSILKSIGQDKDTAIPKFSKPVHTMLKLKMKNKIACPLIFSHIPYGIHKIIEQPNYEYVTFLRDPISRWLSSLYHSTQHRFKNDKTHFNLFYIMNNSKTPEEFLTKCLNQQINFNIMTRQISGIEDFTNNITYIGHKEKTGRIYVPYNTPIKTYSEENMKTFYEHAIKNIKTFSFIGYQDNFDLSIKEFAKKFGYKYQKSSQWNKTKNETRFTFTSNECILLLKELNKWDIKLIKELQNDE